MRNKLTASNWVLQEENRAEVTTPISQGDGRIGATRASMNMRASPIFQIARLSVEGDRRIPQILASIDCRVQSGLGVGVVSRSGVRRRLRASGRSYGGGYLDRAAPDFAPAKFRVLAFSIGPLIELDCGSNCPGRIIGPGKPAAAWRFLIFCAALAFARRRALALVMGSVPFRVAGGSLAVSWPDVLIGDPADRPEWK